MGRRKAGRLWAAAAAAAAIWIAAGAVAMPASASAADSAVQEYRYAYTDAKSGRIFYNTEKPEGDGSYTRRVVVQAPNGDLAALPAEVRELQWTAGMSHPQLMTYGLKPQPFHDTYYDEAAGEIVAGNVYVHSPSGKFGLKIIPYAEKIPAAQGYAYGFGFQKHFLVLVKNNQNGVIRMMGDFPYYPNLYWLPDGSLMQQRYNDKAGQNELMRYNPDTDETGHLMFASMLGYDAGRGLLLYALNEPARQRHIYDFATGTSRLAGAGEAEAILAAANGMPANRPPAADDKSGPDADTLPVADAAYSQAPEAELVVSGQTFPLPYAYFGADRQLYVPMKPVADARGWELTRNEGDEFSYAVNTGKETITVDKRNGIVLEERLFVRMNVLLAAGYTDMGIRWVVPGEAS